METIRHISGDTFRRAWIVGGSENPVDLTDASARLQLRDERTDEVIFTASTATSGLTITPLDGRIDLRLEGATMALEERVYVFDIELTEADGTITTLEQAKIKIIKDYTRA